ncbi:MAG: DNA/RNA non-specific endonuclease [Leptolyngbyaceae cyanobacterium bins.59]|nr:DNA/RNA non-specific endonuclease [Leptolyngbyaceae cyanobacterium bins.59]
MPLTIQKLSRYQFPWKRIAIVSSLLLLNACGISDARNFGSLHLLLGTPSPASPKPENANDYLMLKRQYALSYNNSKGTPNWVSWQLNASWMGEVDRCKSFSPDSTLPPGFQAVLPTDYTGSGFSRGHMTRSYDRSATEADNCATFLMTNIVPQTQDNNEGPWLELENLAKDLAEEGRELYIIAGPLGQGGTGLQGRKLTIGKKNKITVPAQVWKIVVVMEKPGLGPRNVTANTRVIAVNMPNRVGIKNKSYRDYLTTVDELEQQTGYDFLSDVPKDVQAVIEARKDGLDGKLTNSWILPQTSPTP